MSNKYYLIFFIVILQSLFLMSCVTTNKQSEENLNDIITKYWSSRLSDKYEETYKYESKTGLPDFNDYAQRAKLIKRFEIKSFSIKNIEKEGNRAIANIEFVTIMPPISKPIKNILNDEWIKEDGGWRHIFR